MTTLYMLKKWGAFFTLQSHKHELNFGCQCLGLHLYLLKSINFLHNNNYGPQNNHVLCHSNIYSNPWNLIMFVKAIHHLEK
jgi:hypothetical protein